MAINKCEIDGIRSRANSGQATNQDCNDLLSVLDDSYNTEAVISKIEEIVERALEDAISQSAIVNAVERALEDAISQSAIVNAVERGLAALRK